MKTTIIINEQHSLLPTQKELLNLYPDYEILPVPATGWDKLQMDEIRAALTGRVVMVSPIPYLVKTLSQDETLNNSPDATGGVSRITELLIFCNDQREKKELPNGKIISVTAKEGWYLA